MRFLRKVTQPEIFIRLGLAITFLYSGFDILLNEKNWVGYVNSLPDWILSTVTSYVSIETFLKVQGATEIIFGITLLLWFLPKKYIKLVAIFISIKLALILWFIGIDPITFRDIGLLGMSLALISIASKKH